jgi:hypothetical protein
MDIHKNARLTVYGRERIVPPAGERRDREGHGGDCGRQRKHRTQVAEALSCRGLGRPSEPLIDRN